MSQDAVEKRLAELYQSITEQQAELAALMRETTDHSPLPDTYTFEGPEGTVRLSELFGDKDDLIVVHNMGRTCPYCTLWADGLNGMRAHLEDRAAFVVVSPDAPAVQQAFARERGWTFRMLSDASGEFTTAMGYREVHPESGKAMVSPGFSTFRRDDQGEIRRVSRDMFGPGDVYCAVWPMFALLDGGADGWQPRFRY